MVPTLPPELWKPIIHLAASSLSDLAVLSALTPATRALCWTPLTARHKILTNTLVDGERAIDIFAGDPKLLKNPRAFPDLPEFLSLLFSEEVPPKTGRRRSDWDDDEDDGDGDEDDYEHVEGLLERICAVDGDENEDWVRACIRAWPIDIKRLTAPTPGSSRSGWRHKRQHFAQAVVNLLCRGRVNILPMMVGDITGEEAMKAVNRGDGVVQIIRESRDPMPVLVELLNRRGGKLRDNDECPRAIGAAAARGLVDVIKLLGGLNPGLDSSPGRWRHIWRGIQRNRRMTMDINTVMVLADLGVRIDKIEILRVLTHPSRVTPQSIEDDPLIHHLVHNMYEVEVEIQEAQTRRRSHQLGETVIEGRIFPLSLWVLIDRPRLRQQLIERRILPPEPASLSACLATAGWAGPDVGRVELAQRAIDQGARVTQEGILGTVVTSNVDLARLVLDATDPHDLAQWRELDVWPRFESVGDMWSLLVGTGFKVTRHAIMSFAFQRGTEHSDDNAAVSILRDLFEAAKAYKHEVLRQIYGLGFLDWRNEEDVRLLAVVKMLLDFGFLPSKSDYIHAKKCLAKTAKLLEEHLEKIGLSVDALGSAFDR